MDVSEFLRLNAHESSQLQMKNLRGSRSSGDGQDSTEKESASETEKNKTSGSFCQSVLLSAPNAVSTKSLIPYVIPNGKVIHKFTQKKSKSLKLSDSETKIITDNSNLPVGGTIFENKSRRNSVLKIKEKVHDLNKVDSLAQSLPKDVLTTPLNVELLNAPRDIFLNKEKISIIPKPPGVPTSKHSSIKYIELTRKTVVEPKFVPFEPYKGCVEPIEGKSGRAQTKLRQNSKSRRKNLYHKPNVDKKTAEFTIVHQENGARARAKLEMAVQDFEKEKSEWELKLRESKLQCEQFEQQLMKSQREKTILEDQLSIQRQVNGELKKLLVASVGEDMQGRVHLLTEDKARMATMIRRYSEKLDRDYEERERMAILCDVWKSKFLASSVLVEELGSWKAALLRWTAEAAEALSTLLDEHSLIRTHSARALKYVSQLVAAFDPLLWESSSHSIQLPQQDGVSMSLVLGERSQALHQRLLGPLTLHPLPPVLVDEESTAQHCRTPAEKMAMQVLERRESCIGYLGYSGAHDGVAFAHPLHMAANTLPSHMTVSCCAHCSGEIQLL